MRTDKKRDEIFELVNSVGDGITISEVSEKLKISRATASNHLAYLAGSRQVYVRVVGNSKLHYPMNKKKSVNNKKKKKKKTSYGIMDPRNWEQKTKIMLGN